MNTIGGTFPCITLSNNIISGRTNISNLGSIECQAAASSIHFYRPHENFTIADTFKPWMELLESNSDRAISEIQSEAEQGSVQAQIQLGLHYLYARFTEDTEDQIIERNREAVEWFKLAARQNFPPTQQANSLRFFQSSPHTGRSFYPNSGHIANQNTPTRPFDIDLDQLPGRPSHSTSFRRR